MIMWITAASCVLALIPAVLFLRNLSFYAPLPPPGAKRARVSVLIPARNEATNISDALRSILQSDGLDFEVVVLDDGSTDRTAEIVRTFATGDPRVRLETAQPLPAGWCGKNFACHQLASLARHPLLIFMDADVRVSRPDSLARLVEFVEQSGASLVSGVPYEETRGLAEKLIIPLIHFVLLGFLPIERMRKSTDPRFAAACGQILAVRRDAYERAGGHTSIADRIHDAVALTRAFRAHGFATDLFDATDTFRCRMYQRASEVWHGFAKNAHEGLGSPPLIVPATFLLLGGQVLPLLLLAFAPSPLALLATLAAFAPRLIAVVRFRQSALSALLHPIGICALVAIQWFAFFRSLRKRPAVWKGRSYSHRSREMKLVALALFALHGSMLAAPITVLRDFELSDQDARTRSYRFPKAKVTVMTVADHKGSDQLAPWIQRLHDRYQKRLDIDGIADVSMIPKPFQNMFRAAFKKQLTYSVMLDWEGSVVKQFAYAKGVANLYVIDHRGRIVKRVSGAVSDDAERELTLEIERLLGPASRK